MLIAKPIDGTEAERIMNIIVEHLCETANFEALQRLRESFSNEFSLLPDHFSACQAREYYVAENRGRNEALIGISPKAHTSTIVDLTSIARILPKNSFSKTGAEYLEIVLETILFLKGVKRVVARATTPGGIKAFEDLQKRCTGKNYWVEIVPSPPVGMTAMVIRA